MTILQDILTWSQTLPAWQSDAIARLFIKQNLAQTDLDDLYALLKAEHGVPDPKGRTANKLKAEQIPSAPSTGSHVELVAIKNLRHVNAIAENQRLAFSPSGLTVIYGDNGSGKSGYTRVLKRACRARDHNEPIHPKANLPPALVGPAEATFELSINGVPDEVVWNDGQAGPKALSTIAIFDTRCARAYLDAEDDFSYVPYGLDILKGLAQTCNQLEALVTAELRQNEPDTTNFDELSTGGTAVATLIAGLSAKTKPERVEALAKLSEKEMGRRAILEQSLRAEDPSAKAAQLRLLSNRIAKIAKSINEKSALVNDEALSKLQELGNAKRIAKDAARLAAQTFDEDKTLLQGTGSEAWKRLFEAARDFYHEACPNMSLSHLDPNMPCPLCQQPLNDGAGRLMRFEKFLHDETEKTARLREREFDEEQRRFCAQTVALGFDTELHTEIESKSAGLGNAVIEFEALMTNRHAAIKDACVSQEWGAIGPIPESPAAQLLALSEVLAQEATSLENAADETARREMQIEFNELEARLRLAKVKSSVLKAISSFGLEAKLTKCLRAVRTNAISRKATELATAVISQELAGALNNEFKALAAESLSVTLHSRSARGKTLHKLTLGFAQTKKPEEVLSEGEQRAIAIGSFLAEVNLGGGKGGVVFDDPVSSLDHKRRERVAARLVKEALTRQVIVFTHDVYFVSVILDEARRSGAECVTQSLTRRPEGYGVADSKLPFEVMGTRARVGELRNLQQQIAKLFKIGDEPEHRRQTAEPYRHLRIAWERAVEEILFRNVVIRFRKGISTQLLSEVIVEDSDYALIESQMTKCSNYAHDQALLGGTVIPDPAELLTDINTLETWREQVEKRVEVVRKKRKGNTIKGP